MAKNFYLSKSNNNCIHISYHFFHYIGYFFLNQNEQFKKSIASSRNEVKDSNRFFRKNTESEKWKQWRIFIETAVIIRKLKVKENWTNKKIEVLIGWTAYSKYKIKIRIIQENLISLNYWTACFWLVKCNQSRRRKFLD